MFKHITNYWVIVGFTEVRFWESLVKSLAFLTIAVTVYCLAARKDHCFGKVLFCIGTSWAALGFNSVTVAVSLWISPVPSVARAGVSVMGFLGAIGSWYLAISTIGHYDQVAYMLTGWTRTMHSAKLMTSRDNLAKHPFGRFRRETKDHGAS